MFSEQQEKWLFRVTELFFRYGIKALTMDDVARELGISKKTLYTFVDNKDDLVLKAIQHHLQKEVEHSYELQQKSSDAVDEMLLVIRDNMADMAKMKTNIIFELQRYHRDAWEQISGFQQQFLYKVVRENLERGIREGFYRSDFEPDIITKIHIVTTFQLFDEAIFPISQYPREKLFQEAILHYLYGILSEKGLQHLKEKLKTN